MATLYVVGFQGKKLACIDKIDTGNETVAQSLRYGGSVTFKMYGDHGVVADVYFRALMVWDGKGKHYTPYFEHNYKG